LLVLVIVAARLGTGIVAKVEIGMVVVTASAFAGWSL
jgi:hypothetical protein